jgi:hypothetical protein
MNGGESLVLKNDKKNIFGFLTAVSCNRRKPIAGYLCLSFSYHVRKSYLLYLK